MNVLLVCPLAVGPAWVRQIGLASTATPWHHQQAAASWAEGRDASMFAMDMGTGKSLTALLSLKCGPLTPVLLVDGSTKVRASRLRSEITRSKTGLAVIVNYDSVWRGELSKVIESVTWDAILLDESHRIKSPGGRASRWLAGLARRHPKAKRLCLTGTPMPHSPLDLYGQFRFLSPDVFGTSFARFRARYASCDTRFPGKVLKWLRQEEMTEKLDSHSWRVTAEEVLDLPEAIHEVISVSLGNKTNRFYAALEHEMTAAIEAGTVTVSNALTKLLRLQQATGGYARTEESGNVLIDGTPTKAAMLEDLLEDLPATEPFVVFCRFRSDLNEIAALSRRLGRQYAELSGERRDLESWQDGNATILGVQIQSGGAGIDLTRAAYCCYYSLGFSLGEYEQSLARLRRPGQTRCVRYYHMVAKGTVDEQVYEALSERRSVVDAVLQKLSPRKEASV